MIKFFRKIRQRLLSENKLSKYLIYAIGEIILVVIGILIALQINNWNEDKSQKDELKIALTQILNDLKQDKAQLTGFQKSDTKRFNYLTKLANKEYNSVGLDSVFLILDNYFYFYKSNNSYSGLKSSGLFASMANHQLKNDITSYYEQTYERLRVCSEYGETFTNENVIPFMLKSIDYNQAMLVDEQKIRDELNNPVLAKLIKYQRNVKLFELNLLNSAIAKNEALQKIIKIQVREF
ncbi:DUF6090 family protein [Winogradskyella flava]|uniref:Uncharacterized protein n=1 Tax=Winogradskyella flava TaxID=1884876 RepID=A0A842IT73_9FLAO|nr:DUF6090 family protein [Winogradskyella flava]MBC2844058.1 hypothetical protein [Winogradskyella flava]